MYGDTHRGIVATATKGTRKEHLTELFQEHRTVRPEGVFVLPTASHGYHRIGDRIGLLMVGTTYPYPHCWAPVLLNFTISPSTILITLSSHHKAGIGIGNRTNALTVLHFKDIFIHKLTLAIKSCQEDMFVTAIGS